MTRESETILRKSLDDVDRIKKRQALGFIILMVTTAIGIVWLGRLSENPAIDVRRMLVLAVCVLVFIMAYVAMAIAMVITKMTRKVLKAIELVSKA